MSAPVSGKHLFLNFEQFAEFDFARCAKK